MASCRQDASQYAFIKSYATMLNAFRAARTPAKGIDNHSKIAIMSSRVSPDNKGITSVATEDKHVQPGAMRLYSLRIKDNGTLVRLFVPCVNNSTSKAGLYDLVNGKFYGNANIDDSGISPVEYGYFITDLD